MKGGRESIPVTAGILDYSTVQKLPIYDYCCICIQRQVLSWVYRYVRKPGYPWSSRWSVTAFKCALLLLEGGWWQQQQKKKNNTGSMFQNEKIEKGGARTKNVFSSSYKEEENMGSPGFCLSLGQGSTIQLLLPLYWRTEGLQDWGRTTDASWS